MTKQMILLVIWITTIANAALPTAYNVVWDTPSRDSLDSMPLSGRRGAAANVWVQDGSVWLYLAHNGAYDEQGRLLKLGCVRITPVDGKLGETDFRQELALATGSISIQQGDFKASLWFAGETLIFESTAAKAVVLDVAFGAWRDQKRDGVRIMLGLREQIRSDKAWVPAGGKDQHLGWACGHIDRAVV
jgi:hypothetical protein